MLKKCITNDCDSYFALFFSDLIGAGKNKNADTPFEPHLNEDEVLADIAMYEQGRYIVNKEEEHFGLRIITRLELQNYID